MLLCVFEVSWLILAIIAQSLLVLILIYISQRDIMSNPSETPAPNPTKPPINKKELFADAVAFCSIVSSYFFISLTLHFNIFESQLALELNNSTTIIILYLSYAIFIATFKVVATVIGFIKKAQGESELVKWLNDSANFSLFTVLIVSGLYLFVHSAWRVFTIQQFCHIAVWLWIGEISKILGGLSGRLSGINSFDYFGKSVAVILSLGALLEPLGLGIFAIF